MVQTPVPPPDNITDLRVTGQRVTVTGGQTVIVIVNFTWTEPEVPYGELQNYDVWLGRRALLPRENPPVQRPSIQVHILESTYTTHVCVCVCVCVHVCVCVCARVCVRHAMVYII